MTVDARRGPWRATWEPGASRVQIWHAEVVDHPVDAVNVYDHEAGRVTLTDPDGLAAILAAWIVDFGDDYARQVPYL